MRMRTKLSIASRMSLRIKQGWIALGTISLAGSIIFISYLYTPDQSTKYSIDLTSTALKNVNFTVLTTEINSDFDEVRPFITANGKCLFFCRRNHPENVSKQKDRQDIWISTLDNETNSWSKPENLGVNINSKYADAICSVNSDGTEIIFITDKYEPNKPLMRSVKTKDGWQVPEVITIEKFYNNHTYIDFFYSFDAHVLLMAVERQDTHGEQDLYVSLPKGKNQWAEPINLGSMINSSKSDFAPFLSADGKTLYFSSYGHQGLGGCDIFKTTRLDSTWTNWSEPVNLGEGINSAREESYFSVSGDDKTIYFESYDAKKDIRDLFRADLPTTPSTSISPYKPTISVDEELDNNMIEP